MFSNETFKVPFLRRRAVPVVQESAFLTKYREGHRKAQVISGISEGIPTRAEPGPGCDLDAGVVAQIPAATRRAEPVNLHPAT